MNHPRDSLKAELDKVDVTQNQIDALLELAYTASETGIIPFAISDDAARELIALVKLSFNYKWVGVPSNLRM